MKLSIFLTLLLSVTSLLHGEIKQVQVTWTSNFCKMGCQERLQEQFKTISNAESMQFSSAGVATFKWRAGKPLSYEMFKRPMQKIGVSLRFIYATVVGTIEEKEGKFSLISSQDRMRFELVGPPDPADPLSHVRSSSKPRPIPRELEEQFRDLAASKQSVQIEGNLYQAYRAPPYRLVVQRVSLVKPKNDSTR